MGLERLLKKSVCTAVLGGMMLLNAGCRDSEFMRNFNFERIETQLPVNDLTTKRKITDTTLIVSDEFFKYDETIGSVYFSGLAKCEYKIRTYQEWTDRVAYDYYRGVFAGGKTSGIREEMKSKEVGIKKFEYVPSHVSINIRDESGGNIKAIVDNGGNFSSQFNILNFTKKPNKKYYDVLTEPYDLMVSEADSSGRKPAGASFEPVKIGKAKKFYYAVNISDVENYVNDNVNSKVFTITINSKDFNTRAPVGLEQIVVKCESSSPIEKILKKEFGGDEELLKAARASVEFNPEENKKTIGSGQSLAFTAFEGMKYSVETTDSNYHYTKSSFVAKKDSDTKSVLLVEVGKKVRIDDSEEGKGSLIDDD